MSRHRLLLPVLVGLAAVVDALRRWNYVHPDWRIARHAGHQLLTTHGLHVYADRPDAQMGPLALVLAQLERHAYAGLVAFSVAAVVAVAVNAARTRRALLVAWVAGGFVVTPWSQLAWKGHADDALVVLGAVLALEGLATMSHGGSVRRARLLLVGGFALGILGKPTAVALGPLLLADPLALRLGLLVTVLVWAPFAVVDPGGLLHAGRGIMRVAPGSLPDYLGTRIGAHTPRWVRPLELVGGIGAAAAGVLRHRAAEGLLLAFALRAVLETVPAPAYAIPLVALAILPDVRRGSLVLTPLAATVFWLSQPVLDGGPGWPRMLALGVLIAVLVARMAELPRTLREPARVWRRRVTEPVFREIAVVEHALPAQPALPVLPGDATEQAAASGDLSPA